MKTVQFSGEIATAYGKTLPSPLPYSGSFTSYESLVEIPEKDRPSEEEILGFVNAREKANARQKVTQEVLDAAGIQKPKVDASAEGIQLAMRNMIRDLKATGRSEEDAKLAAETVFGVSFGG